MNGNAALRTDLNPTQRTISARAVVLGCAGNTGAHKHSVPGASLLLSSFLPDQMPVDLVQNLLRAHGDGVRVAGHGPAARPQSVPAPEFDGIHRQRYGN